MTQTTERPHNMRQPDYLHMLLPDQINIMGEFLVTNDRRKQVEEKHQEADRLNLEINRIQGLMNREGNLPHHLQSIKWLEKQLQHLTADLPIKRILVTEAESFLFQIAKRYIGYYKFLKLDFDKKYIGKEQFLKYLSMYKGGLDCCEGFASLESDCREIQEAINKYLLEKLTPA